jgi:hypothetical protein
MTFSFRPAVRSDVNLIIGLVGESGSGKTMTAMRLAKGICGGERFAVIDTERGRSRHYADFFQFDVCDLEPPFSPENYMAAIMTAEKAGYRAIMIDSMSHEHAGEGGLLDQHEAELQRMAGDDFRKREACKLAAWVRPKNSHKSFVQKLLQVNCHLLLCFRAEKKVRMEKQDGKTVIVDAGFLPISEKNLPYEMTVSFLFSSENPGVPDHPLKMQKQFRSMFPTDKPIDEEAGRLIDAWARGAKPEARPAKAATL